MRDSFSEGGVVLAIAPQTMTKTTVYGSVIDLAGYESITFYMVLGDMTNADPADELDFMIYDSAVGTQAGGAGTALDSSALVDPTATPDNILVDTKGAALKGAANAFDNTVYKYGYLGPNRYVQVVPYIKRHFKRHAWSAISSRCAQICTQRTTHYDSQRVIN